MGKGDMVRLGFTKVTATALRDAGRQGDQSVSELASGAEGPRLRQEQAPPWSTHQM